MCVCVILVYAVIYPVSLYLEMCTVVKGHNETIVIAVEVTHKVSHLNNLVTHFTYIICEFLYRYLRFFVLL